MNTRRFLIIASFFGFTAVFIGAFGAHIMKRVLSEENFQIFDTAVKYQFYHTFAIALTALIGRYTNQRWAEVAGWLFFFGIIFFSGSLYLLATHELLNLNDLVSFLGPLTPIGGLLFMGGWLALLRSVFDYKKMPNRNRSSSSKSA